MPVTSFKQWIDGLDAAPHLQASAFSELAATGERYLPSMVGAIELEHLHRYAAAASLVAGLDVLDLACGSGYGSAIMARQARCVTGVDIDPPTIASASRHYPAANIVFLRGDCAAVPLGDQSVDAVISFETIEHHDAHAAMLAEIDRVLRPDGFVLISSPNRAVYSDEPGYTNPYHVRELYLEEFRALLLRHFPHVRMLGQALTGGSLLRPLQSKAALRLEVLAGSGDRLVPGQAAAFEPMYFLALCARSAKALPKLPASLFLHAEEDFLRAERRRAPPPASPAFHPVVPDSLYKPPRRVAGLAAALAELSAAGVSSGLVHGVVEGCAGTVRGWARRIDTGAPAPYIVVGDSAVAVIAMPNWPRPDVAEVFSSLASWMCGFGFDAGLLEGADIAALQAVAVWPGLGAFALTILQD